MEAKTLKNILIIVAEGYQMRKRQETVVIIQVHLGSSKPVYLYDQLQQSRLFNPGIPIFLIVNNVELFEREKLKNVGITGFSYGAMN